MLTYIQSIFLYLCSINSINNSIYNAIQLSDILLHYTEAHVCA